MAPSAAVGVATVVTVYRSPLLAIKGISLPAMPSGSPGMAGPKEAPFEALASGFDGSPSRFGSY